MANYIEYTTLPITNFVLPTSRYANSQVIYYTDDKRLTFTTYKRGQYNLSGQDQYMVISKGYEYRPDLVSRDAYGTVDFWWRIMEANGMKDILEFKAGTNIRLPDNVYF